MLKMILIIGSGSFIGGISRYLTSRMIHNYVVSGFPIGTFTVNIIGCFLIGFIYGVSERGNFLNPDWRLFLTIGFCGGFTTFSAFASENVLLIQDRNFILFAIYSGLSVFLGILSTYLGSTIARMSF